MTYLHLPNLFVSCHRGAVEWARRRGLAVQRVAHLRPESVRAGQKIIGTLPAHLAAQVCAAGGIYLHLCIDVPAHLRGQELSADTMELCGARLVEIKAEILNG